MMDFNKALIEYLYDKGYCVSYHKGKAKIRFGSESIKIYKKDDLLILEEFVISDSGITVANYPLINLKKTEIGNIYDPKLFDILLADLERRKLKVNQENLKVDDSIKVYRGEKV